MIDRELAKRLDAIEGRLRQPAGLSIERKVSIGVVFAIVLQAALGVWWASKVDSQVVANGLENAAARSFTIAEVARLDRTIAANREWQIEQRVRVWDRVNDLSLSIEQLSRNIAGLRAAVEATRDTARETQSQVNRIFDLLLRDRGEQPAATG